MGGAGGAIDYRKGTGGGIIEVQDQSGEHVGPSCSGPQVALLNFHFLFAHFSS